MAWFDKSLQHGDDWIYKQDCAACMISITDPSVLIKSVDLLCCIGQSADDLWMQKCSVLQGLCTPTFKGRFGNREIEL